jgi:AcrR family transcriptional regulator
MSRTGRRPGLAGTKDAILAAARRHFAELGYERATLRGIAAEAGVDAKLILHYFGSKEGIFRVAVAFPIDPAETIPPLLQPGLNGLGARVVDFFVETLESPSGSRMLALIRSAVASESAAALVREYIRREILARVAAPLQVDQPELRASLVASQLVGLAVVRYVVKVEPLASAPPAAVSEWLGPTLQRYLTEPTATSTRAELPVKLPLNSTAQSGAGDGPRSRDIQPGKR